MAPSACKSTLLLLTLGLAGLGAASPDSQVIFSHHAAHAQHQVDPAILAALKAHKDPVDAYIALHPEAAEKLAEKRLLRVAGEKEAQWMTEGDKMRLRRQGRTFADITDYDEFYKQNAVSSQSGKAHLPKLSQQRLVKPLFPQVSKDHMEHVLKHLTSFYTRYFGSVTGEQSALWLRNHIADIIKEAPFHTHISLDVFPHAFPQPSIIARFEPKVANFSAPLTILGAHQDSMNYLFPLLPAPGADDDCSGTASILEAFRVLAHNGYIPRNGPVEFHWYAAEEGGLLGSQAIAKYKKQSGVTIGAMLEFDMTAFIAKNATESIGIIETSADKPLTKWVLDLAKEYSKIESAIYQLQEGAGSDYMSFTNAGFPAAFASEGDPISGEFDPYVHGVRDTMDVDDETGKFSLDHMARFSELALAFVVEQAGWNNDWR
ncbi:peptidase [Cordyceps militaris CM01]|uniref:Peptide hydrolase n=1 Tax=Cordyceps militaris (strain CM01) TaxID=983644 RepID=G3JSW6_CORMM|nr:peptidase [Cordyceps militaris CM01]EGX88962.1 peptidase [Cordyceps militaris CM01]